MKYYYTKWGDVYPGELFHEINFHENTIVIQRDKIQDYNKLTHSEKTIDKIREYGWILRSDAIAGTLDHETFKPQKSMYEGDTWDNGFERKYMFIIGAGASANCVYGGDKDEFLKNNLRPPLGLSLFEKRFKNYYSLYKGVEQCLPFLQNAINQTTIEDFFEEEWKEIYDNSNYEMLSRHINTQYYIQHILREVGTNVIKNFNIQNLYAIMAYKLQAIYARSIRRQFNKHYHKKFAFISFNQDTILEHFISQYFKKPLSCMDDYINVNDSPFCIFKPHGSWNWGWKFPKPEVFKNNTAQWLFENNTNLFQLYYQLLGNHVNMIDWSTFGHEWSLNENYLGKYTIDKSQLQLITGDNLNNYYPGLLIPYKNKDEFTMPLRHFDNMKFYLNYVETLIIIGWKGNETAFNRLLSSTQNRITKVIIVDPNHKEVVDNLQGFLNKMNITPKIYPDFENFVLTGLDAEII